MKAYLRNRLLPIAVAQSLLLYALALAAGVPLEAAVLAGTLIALGLAILAERLWPYREDWHPDRRELIDDASSAGVVLLAIDPLLKSTLPILAVALYPSAATLASWPLFAEIVVVSLLIELGKYLSHRAHHQFAPLWCLHAMHHSPEKLNAVNGFRVHPLNYLINGLAVLPPLYLGASPEAVFGYLALTQPVQMLQHANADLDNGFWNHVFSSNELHRWHHAADARVGHANYGNALAIWDQVFGTWRGPGHVVDIGLFARSRAEYPARAGYWRQLLSCGVCCARA